MRLVNYDPAMRHVTREEMREIDRRAVEEFGIPVRTLMENAGLSVAEQAASMVGKKSRIAVLCGKGNNGGDGFVAARALRERGYAVSVHLAGCSRAEVETSELLRENLERALSAGAELRPDVEEDLVIDAITGTGMTRPLSGDARWIVDRVNHWEAPILAVDIPTGLDADTGFPIAMALRATVTVTMGLPKKGFLNPRSREYTGEIRVAEIGFPPELIKV